jgi:hypothetical protein
VSDTPQGPGWWQASDGKWYPPEQQPGSGGAATPGGGGTPGVVDVGAAFNWTWAKFQQNMQPLLILGAVVAGVQIIWWLINTFFLGGAVTVTGGFGELILSFTGSIVVSIITLILTMLAIQAALDIADGKTIDTSTIFQVRANIGVYIVGAILFGILQFLGCLLFCVGLVFVWLIFGLWNFAIVDRGAGIGEAFSISKDLTMKNFGQTFLPMLVYFLLFAVALYACALLGVITLPLAALYGAYVFRTLSGQPVAA